MILCGFVMVWVSSSVFPMPSLYSLVVTLGGALIMPPVQLTYS